MRPWNAWLYGLGLTGVLVFGLAGCGGGDVPDAGDDQAATEEAGDGPTEPAPPPTPEPAPAATKGEAVADEAAPATPTGLPQRPPGPDGTPGAVAAAPSSSSATPDAAPAATSPTDPAAANTRSDTAEMLAAATGAAAPPTTSEAPATPGAAGATPPGAPGLEPTAGDLLNSPGIPSSGRGPGASDSLVGRGPGGEMGRGGMSGFPGGPGGSGGAGGGASDPGDTNSPDGAVKAFLHALQAKDKDRLLEATALRANSDEGGKYREMFSRIIDGSMSDSEIDDLSTKLAGYTVAGENQVKSTGRLGVTIRKQLEQNGGWLQRTVTVRKEKKGWGVLDISGATEFDNARSSNPNGNRGRRP
ncbi:hypothetical protein [Paludisphaera mucosa]|uniref:Uncharacterized protein n=1 Tax=Paludisphaera mucosa TaxID=3030827 RepID=A0ABT6F7Y1_9BACT|nr:hypothetical protein [Paludisphaera mucosa]MDG3003678.1 hypothetical protein [Paludisphaera mucosa]